MLKSIENTCGRPIETRGDCTLPEVCAPRYVALTGKGQWKCLFDPPLKECDHGLQTTRPPGWPFPPSTRVFVLSSSSGRAAMTDEVRAAPYAELARLVKDVPWEGLPPLPYEG